MKDNKNLNNPVILLNGISRSGKAITWYVVSSVKNIDVPLNEPFPDWILDAFNSNDITSNAVEVLLSNYFRIYAWYSFIGRGINLKKVDQSSFLKLSSKNEISTRNKRHDNSESWQEFSELWSQGKFIPCFTTDLNRDLQEKLTKYDFNFININTIRNPKKVFLEWCLTNRGGRYDELDRMGKYYFTFKNQNIPGFAFEYKEQWYESSPEERCYLTVSKYYDGFFKSENKNEINIFFEDVIVDPLPEIKKVANLLGLDIKDNYKEMFALMNVPREFDDTNYILDPENFFKKISKEAFDNLCHLEERYNRFKSEQS